MLKFMRKYGSSWFIKIILLMIIVTFVGFFGWTAVQGPFTRDVVATVDGEPVSLGEYQNAFRRTYELFQRVYGDTLDEAMVNRLQIPRQALETVVRSRIQVRQAHLAGLRVSDEELSRHIRRQPAFQRNGRFDRALYLDALRRNRVPVAAYEAEQRLNLLLSKIEAIIRDGVKVAPAEVEEAFLWSRERAKVRYMILLAEELKKNVQVGEDALRAFFDKEKEQFRVPKKLKAAYFFADIQALEGSVQVTDEEIAKEYERRKDEYREAERRNARHILLKLSPGAKPEDVEKVKAKAEDLIRRLRNGADFAALAKEFSEDPNAEKGGELGSFGRGELDPEFEKAVFGMEVGELRGPVRTDFGFHIIRLDGIEGEKVRPLSEVKASIADGLRARRAAEKARDAIEKVWDELSQGRPFEDFPETPGVKRGVSEFFAADGKGLPVADRERVAAAAFKLGKEEISDPIEGEGGWYIVRIVDEQPSQIPEMKEVRGDVEKAYVQHRSKSLAEERAKELVGRLERGESLEQMAKEAGLNPIDSPFFTRNQPIPSLRAGAEFYTKAFELEVGKAAQTGVEEGRVIFVVTDRAQADPKELESDGGRFREEYLRSKQAVVMNLWVNALRESTEVITRPGMQF
ncbi:MAG: SurA N-terminal domain-containing protein [Nitrospinota bacterium]